MFPADFSYARARSLDEALDLIDEARADDLEVKVIAGGQSLLPMMKLRLAAPQVLIDIAGLEDLTHIAGIADVGGAARGASFNMKVGALTTYRELGRDRFFSEGNQVTFGGEDRGRTGIVPAIGDALAVLADPQVRARGTIGGAVAHGDPAADLPAVLLALNASVVIKSRAGRHEQANLPGDPHMRRPPENPDIGWREVYLDDFLQGLYATDLAEDEIVTHIGLHTDGARGSAYEKFPQPASHLPLAGVCAVIRLRDGVIDGAEVAVTGISHRPYRAAEAEAALKGAPPVPETFAAAAQRVTELAGGKQVSLLGDQHASGPYRAHLARVLAARALTRAAARATAA